MCFPIVKVAIHAHGTQISYPLFCAYSKGGVARGICVKVWQNMVGWIQHYAKVELARKVNIPQL